MVADYDASLWTDEAVPPIAPVRQQETIQYYDGYTYDDELGNGKNDSLSTREQL